LPRELGQIRGTPSTLVGKKKKWGGMTITKTGEENGNDLKRRGTKRESERCDSMNCPMVGATQRFQSQSGSGGRAGQRKKLKEDRTGE